ncbi:MAG: hypothetical protein AAF439_09500 [Pseudomonadota bacterium]
MAIVGVLISAILFVVPLWFLLPRAGIPSTVALVAIIPICGLILLWVLAFKRWPSDDVSGRF